MIDLLVLEDDREWIELMKEKVPEGKTYKFVKNGREFEDFLTKGGQARLDSLDDKCFDSSEEMGSHFIKHCTHLLEQRPDAKVMYHGSAPESEEVAYCEEHEIPIIDRRRFGDAVKKELMSG